MEHSRENIQELSGNEQVQALLFSQLENVTDLDQLDNLCHLSSSFHLGELPD